MNKLSSGLLTLKCTHIVCNSPWCWCALVQNAVYTRLRLRIHDRSSIIRSTRIKEDPSRWDSDGICRSGMDPKAKGAVTLLLFRWILLNVGTMPKILHYLIKVSMLLSNIKFSASFRRLFLSKGCVVLPWHFEFYILKSKNLKCKKFFDWFSWWIRQF